MIFFGMNALVLFASLGIDPQLCSRLCLMLAHSVWQVGLLALVATLLVRLQRRENPEFGYAVYVIALLAGLAALPITYTLFDVDSRAIEVSQTSVVDVPSVTPNVQQQVEQTLQPTSPIAVERGGSQPSAVPTLMPDESQETFLHRFAPWLAGCYAVGVIVMLLRLGQGIWKSHKIARAAAPVGEGSLNQAFQRIVQAWSLRVMPVLAHAQEIVVPQVAGLLRPTILLPTSALSGLSPEELEMILAHELAHVRRHDMWVNLLQRLAESILFFNPALWYLSRRVSTYREYCCDEQTCRGIDESQSRVRYAQALLHVVELSGKGTHSAKIAALAATGTGPSELRRRVARLFGEPLREPMRVSRTGLLAFVFGLILIVAGPLSWQNAAEPVNDKSKQEASDQLDKPTVEVVAIGTHDEEPQQWWDAEGKLLKSIPFEWKDANNVSSQEKVWRRIVFRINALPKNAEVVWDVLGGGSWGDATATPLEAEKNQAYFARYVGLREKSESLGLRVGIASGPWVTSVKGTGLQANGIMGTGIIFSGAFAKDEGCVLVLSHNLQDTNVRVVALDKTGKQHVSQSMHQVSAAGGLNQMHWVFNDLKPNDVDHFEFQTRIYEWTEIDNLPTTQNFVSIQPSEMRLKVVDAEGKPLEGAKVFRNHRFVKTGATKNEIENENYLTDANGEAVIALPGKSVDLRLWVSKSGYVPLHAMWAKEFQSDGDQIPGAFEFRMERGTKIGGVVTNIAGIPISGVKVKVVDATAEKFHIITTPPKPGRRPLRNQYLSEGAAVVTDSEGKWELNNVLPDSALVFDEQSEASADAPIRIRFSHPDYETIDGIDYFRTVLNPTLETLRKGTARTVMKWVDKSDPSRANAVRLQRGITFEGADFHGRHFAGQDIMVSSNRLFNGANLSESVWENMPIPGMSSSFQETDFTRARLISVQLSGGSGGFQNAIFEEATLESADLTGDVSAFQQASFDNAIITNSNLEGGAAAFQDASFRGTKLHSSKLAGSGPAFQKANFDDAQIVKIAIVCNSPTAFQGVSLNNTEFVEADLSSIDAQALESCEFDKATPPRYDAKTKFPEGFDPEEQGWKLIK